MLLQILLKLHEHRDCYWKKSSCKTILEEQFPVLRNTAASKIGNSIICCYDNSNVIATLIITNFHPTLFPGSLSFPLLSPISGRLQKNNSGEWQISVRFVSAKCWWKVQPWNCVPELVFKAMTSQEKALNAENVLHKILWQRRRKELQNIWMLIHWWCFPLQILAYAEEIANSWLVHQK